MFAGLFVDTKQDPIPMAVIEDHRLDRRVLKIWLNCRPLSIQLFALRTHQYEDCRAHFLKHLNGRSKVYTDFVCYQAGFFSLLFNEAQKHQRKHQNNEKPRTICPNEDNKLPFRVTLWSKNPNHPQLARVFIHLSVQLKEMDGKKLYQCLELNGEQVVEHLDWRARYLPKQPYSPSKRMIKEEQRIRRVNSNGVLLPILTTKFKKNNKPFVSVVKKKVPYHLQQMNKHKLPALGRLVILLRVVKVLLDLHNKNLIVGDLSLDEIGIDYKEKQVTLNNMGEAQEFEDDRERWPDLWSLSSILKEVLTDAQVEKLPPPAQAVLKWIRYQLSMDVITHSIIPTKSLLSGFRFCYALTINKNTLDRWNTLEPLYRIEILAHLDEEADDSVDQLLHLLKEKRLVPFKRAEQRRHALCKTDNPGIDQLLELAPCFIKIGDRQELAACLGDHPDLDNLSPLSSEIVRFYSKSNLQYHTGAATLQLAQLSLKEAAQVAKGMDPAVQKLLLPWLLRHGDLKDSSTLRIIEVLANAAPNTLDSLGEWKNEAILEEVIAQFEQAKSPDLASLRDLAQPKNSQTLQINHLKEALPEAEADQLHWIHKLVITWLRPTAEENDEDYAEAICSLEESLLPSEKDLEEVRANCLSCLSKVISLHSKSKL